MCILTDEAKWHLHAFLSAVLVVKQAQEHILNNHPNVIIICNALGFEFDLL